MNNYVVTNIRLPKEDLINYRHIAISTGISFSELVRRALKRFANTNSKTKNKKKHPSFWDIGKMSFKGGPKDGALNHDKYIYV